MATVKGAVVLTMLVALTAARRPPPPSVPPVAATTPAPPTIKTGVEKWRAGDYPAAVAIWTPFATTGDADALFNLGQAYKLGRGVAVDPVAARDYYRKAAVKGHLPAQANLGIALFQAGEKAEAIKWLKTAADRGEARAQYVLGIATFNGDGVARSQSLGYAYLLRAQASGLPQAVTALGTISPGLSPADRTAGEAVAASLAAGTGVPPALAATTTSRAVAVAAPRTTLPVVTPPTATVSAAIVAPAPTPVVAAAPSVAPRSAVSATARPAFDAPMERPVDGVGSHRPSIATVDIPASRPVVAPVIAARPGVAPMPTPPPTTTPVPAAARVIDPLAKPVHSASDPSRPPAPEPTRLAATTASEVPPAPRPLKPFEIAAADQARPSGWRVQLGAFSSRKLADTAWNDVKAAAAPAKPVFATDGPVTKLQVGPFATRDAAKAACTKLTAAGRACFVTAG